MIPPKWVYSRQEESDSLVGYIGNGDVTLIVDFGMFADELNYEGAINFEHINNYMAKIITPDCPSCNITGIHFDRLPDDNKLTILGLDLNKDEQEIALNIFRTIKIKPQ